MRLRILLLESDPQVRKALRRVFDRRGYEVFSFPDPLHCPHAGDPECGCPLDRACADVIVSNLKTARVDGIDFVQENRSKGCWIPHAAILSASWNDDQVLTAQGMGCEVVTLPFDLARLQRWLDEVEKGVDPRRLLARWI